MQVAASPVSKQSVFFTVLSFSHSQQLGGARHPPRQQEFLPGTLSVGEGFVNLALFSNVWGRQVKGLLGSVRFRRLAGLSSFRSLYVRTSLYEKLPKS